VRVEKGFTIVELLVAVTIGGILVGTGFPKLTTFAQEVKLEQEARVVYNDICLLRDACLAAGQGTGTLNLICRNYIPGSLITSYELLDPRGGNFVVNPLMDGIDPQSRIIRNLASRSICIEAPLPADNLPASPSAPAIHTIHIGKNGLVSLTPPVLNRDVNFRIRFYNSTTGTIEPSVGTWSITIANGVQSSTGKIYFRRMP